ncbi:hypothetical protein [[Mycobacterium] vasticus]|uniref:Transmembrane protein n=1 Tax=[Mycobacterium] vasticus TaxID=2875777 RepID=A0ABU5Z0X5_9MYCO|nr:hypothetical protein [Mycolicibacter sp. MYC017]MEB3071027.1 hypothetical protein [Mycolicibacter sp. MYC017]
MLIIALVLAAIGLAALVFAVVTSNALVAWVCIGASLLGVLLLIVDALRERRRQAAGVAAGAVAAGTAEAPAAVDDDDDVAVEADEAVVAVDTAVDGTSGSLDDADAADKVAVGAETSEEEAVPATLGEAIGGGFEVDSAD